MASKVSICNTALSKIGVKSVISTDDTQTRQARACNLIFDDLLEECLSERAWNFATRRIVLGQLVTAPISEFLYQYQLPVDCLQVLKINNSVVSGWTSDGYQIKYKIEGRKLMCNENSVEIAYILSVSDVSELAPLFRSYLTSRLAYELTYALTGVAGLRDRLEKEYTLKLRQAKVADGMEQAPRASVNSTVVNVRYTRGGGRWRT